MKNIFPLLLQLFTALSTNDSLESAALQRLLCKIFYASINVCSLSESNFFDLPLPLDEHPSIFGWGRRPRKMDSPLPSVVGEERAWGNPTRWPQRAPRVPLVGCQEMGCKNRRKMHPQIRKAQEGRQEGKQGFCHCFLHHVSSVEVNLMDQLWFYSYVVPVMESLLRVMSVKRGGGGYLPDKVTQTVLSYLRMWYVIFLITRRLC